MPRKYKPEVDVEYYDYDPTPYCEAVMVESKYGEWVSLKTFEDETARLQATIKRLEAKLRSKLDEQILD